MKALVPVLAGIAIVTSATSIKLWLELRAEQQANIEMRVRPAGSSGVRMAVASASHDTPASTAATTPSLIASADAANPAHPAVTNPAQDYYRMEREMMRDPEYRKLSVVLQRGYVDLNNPDIAQVLGLSEKEAAGLFDLLAEIEIARQIESVDLGNAKPDQVTMEEVGRRQAVQRQQDDSVRAMLGDKYSQWQEYQQSVAVRRQVRSLGEQLAQAGAPLSEVQSRSLTEAMISAELRQRQAARIPVRDGSNPDDPDYRTKLLAQQVKSMEDNTRRIVDTAAPVVSTRQLAVIRGQLELQVDKFQTAMRLQMERERLQSQQQQTQPMSR